MPIELNQDKAAAPPLDKSPPAGTPSLSDLRRKNSKLGLMLASWATSVFAIAIIVVVVVHYVEIHHVLAAH